MFFVHATSFWVCFMFRFSCLRSTALDNRLPDQVPTEELLVPDVCYDDFVQALTKSGSSVSADELTRFTEWTEEFGQEG